MQELVRMRKDVANLHPKYVVILAGTNDIAKNNGFIEVDDIYGNIVSMCSICCRMSFFPSGWWISTLCSA